MQQLNKQKNATEFALVLAKMKKRPAKILILRHSGFSYAEIAEAIGIASSSVGTLLARAEREFERRWKAMEMT